MTAETQIGPDVDLAAEVVRDKQGRRIDEAYAQRLIASRPTVPAKETVERARWRARRSHPSTPPGAHP